MTKFSCAWLKNDCVRTSGVVRRRRVVWLIQAAKGRKVKVVNEEKKYFLL